MDLNQFYQVVGVLSYALMNSITMFISKLQSVKLHVNKRGKFALNIQMKK
jgi:hypothetical protein